MIHDPNATNPEFDFLHNLFTTLNLLGAKPEFVDFCRSTLDRNPTEEDVFNVKRYNASLTDELKGQLARCPSMKLFVNPDSAT